MAKGKEIAGSRWKKKGKWKKDNAAPEMIGVPGGRFRREDTGSDDGALQAYRNQIETTQVRRKEMEPRKEVHVSLPGEGPFILIPLSDIHYGSEATDYEELDKRVKFIQENDNAYGVLLGDEIEGSKPEYRATIEDGKVGTVQDQIENFRRDVLDRIGDKILAAVGGYFGHTEWLRDQGNVDPTRIIYGGYAIPIVDNVSRLVIHLDESDDPEITDTYVDLAHYFSGSSQIDSIYPHRKHYEKKKGQKKPHIVVAGHYHKFGYAEELFPGVPDKAIFMQQGTLKGSNPNLPRDNFGSRIGATNRPGSMDGFFIITDDGHRKPVRGQDLTADIAQALRWRDKMPGDYDEALAIGKDSPPEIKWRNKHSDKSQETEDLPDPEDIAEINGDADLFEGEVWTAKDLAPLYTYLSYNIVSPYPVFLHFLANVRLGSSYSGFANVDRLTTDYFDEYPMMLEAVLNLLDQDVPKSPDRIDVLDEAKGIINRIGPERVLSLTLDGTLRSASWRSKIDGLPYVAPGTYLSGTGVPLAASGATLNLNYGPQKRTGGGKPSADLLLVDGQKRLGSKFKPTAGLKSYALHHDHYGHDVVVSATHEHGGVGMDEIDGRLVHYVDVGHQAPFDSMSGRRNVQITAEGNQGVLFDGEHIHLMANLEDFEVFALAIYGYRIAQYNGMV